MKRLAITTLAGILAAPAFALPDPRIDLSPLTTQISMEGINNLIGDHEAKNIVYVMPGDISVTGLYTDSNGGADCDNLHKFRNSLMRMPDDRDIQTITESGRFYSPNFTATVQVSADTVSIQKKLTELRFESNRIRGENLSLLGEYESAYQGREAVKEELSQLESTLTTLHAKMMLELSTAQNEAERESIRSSYRKVINEMSQKISDNNENYQIAQKKYSEALRLWAPYRNELQYIRTLEEDLNKSLDRYKAKSQELFNYGKNHLDIVESKIVGKATAGYSLASNKQMQDLRERIRTAGLNYDVRQLDIFNVRINPIVSIQPIVKKTGDGETEQIGAHVISGAHSAELGTEEERINFPANISRNGEETVALSFNVKKPSQESGSAQSFEAPITAASYCGQPRYVEKIYSVKTQDNETVNTYVKYPVYDIPQNKLVFAQNIALSYNYYQKAEPIEGSCSMKVDQTSRYVRDHGKKKTGGFWRRRTKSWDNTKHDYSKDMGLSCSLVKSPVGSNPEESALINEALEKSLYQDLFHMFIMSYAKEFSIVEVPPTELGEDSRFFGRVGSGVMNLCGKNKKCEFAGVVLKSLDDLVGSRHSGSSSHTQSSKGTITKDFKLSSYLISQGSANIEMKVCLNRELCK